jgi:hypothetical protein
VLELKYNGELVGASTELDDFQDPREAPSAKLDAMLRIDDLAVVICSSPDLCSPFISCPSTRTSWAPSTILADDANELILVGDSENREVHAFDFEGNVVHSIGVPFDASSLAFRPGLFAPLADVSLETQNLTTSSPIIFSGSFKDRFGEPFTSAVDFSSFAVKASSDVSTEESDYVLTKTVSGVVSLSDSGVVEFAVNATTPGEWTFSIVDVFNNEYVRATDRLFSRC